MIKYAIYDFCQTIVDFETADSFVHYICRFIHNKHMRRIERLRKILMLSGILKTIDLLGRYSGIYLNKKILLYELKGLKKEEIDRLGCQYYNDVICNHLISRTVHQIDEDKKNGYKVIIISASYLPIVKPFCERHGIDELITNEFLYNNENIFAGKIAEKDCISRNKVYRLFKECPDFAENRKYSKSYSDSRSDKPILDIVDKGYIVSREHKKWVEHTDYEEIIW